MGKPTYEELETKVQEMEKAMQTFFYDKVVTKLPFGSVNNSILIEVLISKETFKQIILYHKLQDALKNAKITYLSEADEETKNKITKEVNLETDKEFNTKFSTEINADHAESVNLDHIDKADIAETN